MTREKLTREEVRAALTGPFASLGTPFTHSGDIDYAGLRRLIDFCIAASSKTLMLTYGDSLYSILTDEEVAEMTQAVVRHVAGRAMVIAADRQWATPKEVAFARYAREAGADMLMVLPPDWAASCTVESMVAHYAAVAKEIPVMVVTNVFIPGGAEFGLTVIRALLDRVPNVVALKDDICGEFARKMCLLAHDRWAIVSGGQKQNHFDLLPYGCDGYLSTFLTFKPEIAHGYWKAVQSNDIAAAREVIRRHDMPFFDYIMKLPGGSDAGIHAAAEIFGVAKRWRRPPYYSLNDEEVERLKGFLQSLSLL